MKIVPRKAFSGWNRNFPASQAIRALELSRGLPGHPSMRNVFCCLLAEQCSVLSGQPPTVPEPVIGAYDTQVAAAQFTTRPGFLQIYVSNFYYEGMNEDGCIWQSISAQILMNPRHGSTRIRWAKLAQIVPAWGAAAKALPEPKPPNNTVITAEALTACLTTKLKQKGTGGCSCDTNEKLTILVFYTPKHMNNK